MNTSLVVYTHAYIYLIREREFVLRGEDVFKLGMTKQQMSLRLGRLDAYKKGSELIQISEAPLSSVAAIESELKRLFADKFVSHADGYEFFTGNRREMTRLIFEHTDAAWTAEEQRIQKEMLSRVFEISEMITNNAESAEKSRRQSAEKAEATAEKARLQAAKAVETEEKILSQENIIKNWIADRIVICTDGVVKKSDWYPDFRQWCNDNDIMPLDESTTISTFKSVGSTMGVSVGVNTYGMKLITMEEPAMSSTVDIPSMSKWLIDIIQKNRQISRVSPTKLMKEYIAWATAQEKIPEDIVDMNLTRFGKNIKDHKGVMHARSSRERIYTFRLDEIKQDLIARGYMSADT